MPSINDKIPVKNALGGLLSSSNLSEIISQNFALTKEKLSNELKFTIKENLLSVTREIFNQLY